ncbi:hypothetical protein [Spiroplasma poulsonii]|uniref:hypothetical protein n=1 Tax=Spiroplasma poulsonii TaxID=2138 RepID=UPI001F4C7EEF|nr:hypothetical protein [Spiroplasma poulsonii]UNF62502.1 hypothetical protein MNU24_03320 [Spiroplasma poulsonii]
MIMLLFKESKFHFKIPKLIEVDSGYQGHKNHINVLSSTKKTRNSLNKEQKQYNRLVSKLALLLKIFC